LHGLRGGFDVLGAQKHWPQDREAQHRPHPTLVGNPKEGPTIEKDIAESSPAEGSQERNDGDTDNIDALGRPSQNSRRSKGQNTDSF
jgi:hypothetical protein